MMISPTRNELIANLVSYISLATGLTNEKIIREKQNAPPPLDTYCSILYITDTSIDTANVSIQETIDPLKLSYKFRAKRRYTYSVQFYRSESTNLAKLLMLYHETPFGIQFQQTGLFCVQNIREITENAIVISDNYEQRAVLNMELDVAERQEILVDRVQEVDINLTVDASSVIQETFEVNAV